MRQTLSLQFPWRLPSPSFTYPLTMGVVRAPKITSQPVFSIFSLFSPTLWDLAKSRPVHSLMLSSHLFFCLHCLLPSFTVLCKMYWPDLMNGRHVHTLQFASLYDGPNFFMWSSCLLDLGTDFLVGDMEFV